MEVEVLVMKNPFVLASELDFGTPLLAKTNVGTMDPFGSSKITSYIGVVIHSLTQLTYLEGNPTT